MSDDTPTLYNPPPSGNGDDSGADCPEADGDVSLSVPLSGDVYERLLDVADQLGMSPDLVAARAVEMICAELPEVDAVDDASDCLSTQELIDRYQSHLDLLRTIRDE
jgi:hypothetical protein